MLRHRRLFIGAMAIMAVAACAFDETTLGEASQAQTNGTLASVEWAFSQTPTSGVRLGVRPGGFALSPLQSSTRHFQGVARLASGPYLAMSGSNASELFVAELASRSPSSTGRWGANRSGSGSPPTIDRVIAALDVAGDSGFPTYDHAGGLQAIGNYVVVGLEPLGATRSTLSSAVAFVDVSSPAAPFVARALDRAGQGTAGAVGITLMNDGRWLMAVGEYDSEKIDFYVSSVGNLATATWWLIDPWHRDTQGKEAPDLYRHLQLRRGRWHVPGPIGASAHLLRHRDELLVLARLPAAQRVLGQRRVYLPHVARHMEPLAERRERAAWTTARMAGGHHCAAAADQASRALRSGPC